MNAASLSSFLSRADGKLLDMFLATVTIGGVDYPAAGVGGSATHDWLSDGGGTAPGGTRHFRISKTLLATRPQAGTLLTWAASSTGVVSYTIGDVPDRPHETSWAIPCTPRNR